MRDSKSQMSRFSPALLAAICAAGVAGCKSNPQRTARVDESANLSAHNRLTVRMLQAENVYNANAVERAVYPKDFHPGTAGLNELGERRVESLVHACRDLSDGQIAIVRGDESDALFNARIDAVKKQFTDAGFKADQIRVEGGLPGGERISSGRAILTFDKMMSSYAPRTSGANGSSASQNRTNSSSVSGNSSSLTR